MGGSRTDRRDRSLPRLVTDMLTFLMHLLEGAAVALVVGFVVTFVDDAAEQRQKKRMKIARSVRRSMAGSRLRKTETAHSNSEGERRPPTTAPGIGEWVE